jgi:hypothetical protein
MVCLGQWIMHKRDGEVDGQALSFAARFSCVGCRFKISSNTRTTEHAQLVAHILIRRGHRGILEGERSLSTAVMQLATAVLHPVQDYNERTMELGMAWLIEAQDVQAKKKAGKPWKGAARALVNRKASFLHLFGSVLFIDFQDILNEDPDYQPEP